MTRFQRIRRALAKFFWRLANPGARALAGIAPFWVVVETTGRRSGKKRQTPLARGPEFDGAHWLIAVHGRHSTWVKNLEADPQVRFRLRGKWREGTASVIDYDEAIAARFNLYARSGPRVVGIDPVLVRIELSPA